MFQHMPWTCFPPLGTSPSIIPCHLLDDLEKTAELSVTAGLLRRSSMGDIASSQCPAWLDFGGSWLPTKVQGKAVSSFSLLGAW